MLAGSAVVLLMPTRGGLSLSVNGTVVPFRVLSLSEHSDVSVLSAFSLSGAAVPSTFGFVFSLEADSCSPDLQSDGDVSMKGRDSIIMLGMALGSRVLTGSGSETGSVERLASLSMLEVSLKLRILSGSAGGSSLGESLPTAREVLEAEVSSSEVMGSCAGVSVFGPGMLLLPLLVRRLTAGSSQVPLLGSDSLRGLEVNDVTPMEVLDPSPPWLLVLLLREALGDGWDPDRGPASWLRADSLDRSLDSVRLREGLQLMPLPRCGLWDALLPRPDSGEELRLFFRNSVAGETPTLGF